MLAAKDRTPHNHPMSACYPVASAAPAQINSNPRQDSQRRPFFFSLLRNPISQERKSAPLFSYSYKTIFPQPISFDIDAKPPGVCPPIRPASRAVHNPEALAKPEAERRGGLLTR